MAAEIGVKFNPLGLVSLSLDYLREVKSLALRKSEFLMNAASLCQRTINFAENSFVKRVLFRNRFRQL